MNCLWCKTTFEPRATGGSPQRFCDTDCRNAFHRAARVWAINAIEAGTLITLDQLNNRPGAAYTLAGAMIIKFPAPTTATKQAG
jgi:hypothetical protein